MTKHSKRGVPELCPRNANRELREPVRVRGRGVSHER